MKKLLLFIAIVAGVFSASARDTYSHDINVLPVAAKTVVKNNFKADVSHIKIEKDLGRISEYDVILTDGTEISFDRSGNWKDIEVRRNSSVPADLVPAPITSYVKKNQKNASVVGIEKKRSGYEVELSNGVEIKFNSEGKFIKYDN